jgi:organic radical activating enzyme
VNNEKIPLMEAFYTIQGEGAFQGTPAYFIRLAGCDVGCHWCDVKESWDASKYQETGVDEIVHQAKKYPSRHAVITGGEPLMYDLGPLTRHLRKSGFKTHLETSGAYPLTGFWDWVCLSPKKFKPPVRENFKYANELKIIIYNKSDFAWAEKHMKHVSPDCNLYLQPEWGKMEKIMDEIVRYVKAHPRWKVSLQVHKFMNIP